MYVVKPSIRYVTSNPSDNHITLKANQLDPYTVTHEGLHAAFQAKTPQQQQAFAQVAQQATPAQNNVLNSDTQLGNQIYRGTRPLTEVHSFLPQFGKNSPTNDYYKQYFGNPDFYTQNRREYQLAHGANLPRRDQTPKFSDWME